MLNRSIPSLRTHRSLKTTHIKPSLLQPERNKVEEADELAEHDALRRSVFHSKVAQLFHKRFDLRGRPPRVEVEPA